MNSNKVDSFVAAIEPPVPAKKFTRFSNCMGNLNHLFSGQSHSAGTGELSIRFFFDENSSDARANVSGVAVGTRAKDSLWRRLLEFRASARRRPALGSGFGSSDRSE